MNFQTKSENSSSSFNTVEYAKGSIFNRHIFRQIDSAITPNPQEELYRSHFLYSPSVEVHFTATLNKDGNNTLSGYDDDISIGKIIIDIDDSDLSKALEHTRQVINKLKTHYAVDESLVEVNFSGSKGFHVRLDSSLFGGFEPSKTLNKTAKQIALTIAEGIVKIDESIYDKTRLVRVVNSFNKKSGLYAIPLSESELFTLSIDEIKSLASEPRSLDKLIENIAFEIPALVEIKQKCLQGNCNTIQQNFIDDRDQTPKTTTKKIFEPKSTGERHDTLAVLVGKLIKADWSDDDIYQLVERWDLGNNPPMGASRVQKETGDLLKSYGDIRGDFWRIKRSKKGLSPSINLTEFIEYLRKSGFQKIQRGVEYEFVSIIKNIAKLTNVQDIKDFVIREIKKQSPNETIEKILTELLLDKVSKYFNEKLLETVDTIEMNMKSDSIDKAFLFYKNGIVQAVKGKDIEMHEYKDLDSPIWENQIKERVFNQIKIKRSQSEFEQFLWKVVAGDEDRLLALSSAIGYLLHRYKNKSITKSIILMDEKVSELPEGRTGKSLIGKAISNIRSSVRLDCKNFQFRDQFTFQQIHPSTEIIEFNDVRKDFDFERLFSVLTDDMTVEYKNKSPFIIPFEKSPKIMVSTNYTIKGQGGSFSDRIFEIELSDYYNTKRKPVDEFGHLFFDGWCEDEWNRFDNFMLECLQLYLDEGLIEYGKLNVDEKKLLLETSSDFIDFMRDNFVLSTEYEKEELFNKFKSSIGFDMDFFGKCPVKKNTFSKYLKTYARFRELEYDERNSNGKQYIQIRKVKK